MANAIPCNDKNNLFRILSFRLPNAFKKAGIISATGIFVLLIAYKFIGSDSLIVKDILRTLILFSLLIASLSKAEFEDEYSGYIRFQSLMIAFVFTTAYYILIPLLAILIDFILVYFVKDGVVSFYKISAFEILFTLLGMQLLCYEVIKRFGRAE